MIEPFETYKLIYNFWADDIANGRFEDGGIIINEKLFRDDMNGGCIIIPKDGSYYRTISGEWYDGVDVENL